MKRQRKFGHRTALALFEMIMVVIVLAVLGAGILIWRLSQGPVEIGFAKKYIESELSDSGNNIALRVGKIYLAWNNQESRPEATLQDVQMINTQQDRLIFSIGSAQVSFSRAALLLGQIEPRTIAIDKPLITLIRDASGHISLALDQKADNPDKQIDLVEFLDRFSGTSKQPQQDWPLRRLHHIVISQAKLMVEDHVLGQSWLVPKITVSLQQEGQKGVEGKAALWLDDENSPTPTLNVGAAYDPPSRSIGMNFTLSALRADFLASKLPDLRWLKEQSVTLNGQGQARIDANMTLTELQAGLQSESGLIMIPHVYDHPIAYRSLALNMAYDAVHKTVTLQDSPIVFTDDFSVRLNGGAAKDEDGDWHVPLTVKVDNLPQARIAEYWPAILHGDSSEEWALHRLSKGRIYDATIALALDATQDPPVDDVESEPDGDEWHIALADIKADYAVEGMTVDYRAPLMPVTNAKGHGHFDQATDRLTILVQSGLLGDLDLTDGKVVIDTVMGKAVGKASIDATLNGPLKTILTYISTDPIHVKIPTDIANAKGTASLTVNVAFPTSKILPAEKIDVTAEGTMNDVLLPGLVHNLDVTGGPLNVSVKDRKVLVDGTAKLDGRETKFTFNQYFEAKDKEYSGQVVASIMADADLRKKFGIDLADWMDGTVPAKVTYTDFGGGKAQIDVDADATLLTLMVKPMNYSKPPGQEAIASARGVLQNGELTEIQKLAVETTDAKVENGTMRFKQVGKDTVLTGGAVPRAQLRDTTDVGLDFTISAERLVTLNVTGAMLDATPFLENDKKAEEYHGPALAAAVAVDKLTTAPGGTIDNAKISLAMDNQGVMNRLSLDADAGQGKIVFRYAPDVTGQKMTLDIEAGDAGVTLQAFDLYENVRGGTVRISGESAAGGDKKIVTGKAMLSNFRVVNAPVLARLVNSLSLPGILQLLGSDGITFSRLESDFVWAKKKGGDIITVSDGRTSGSSMGLTFEGAIDRIDNIINITGTIVPVSLVNNMIGNIPVLGDLLMGGSHGGLFAATYSIRGPTKEPTTTVNPLSILAPGFLRKIFFE